MSDEEDFGGIIDDVRTARDWRPIAPLLKEFENAEGTLAIAESVKDILAFLIKMQTKEDPLKNKSFYVYSKFVDLIKNDPQWLAIFEEIVG